jgi:hypothetical protein
MDFASLSPLRDGPLVLQFWLLHHSAVLIRLYRATLTIRLSDARLPAFTFRSATFLVCAPTSAPSLPMSQFTSPPYPVAVQPSGMSASLETFPPNLQATFPSLVRAASLFSVTHSFTCTCTYIRLHSSTRVPTCIRTRPFTGARTSSLI